MNRWTFTFTLIVACFQVGQFAAPAYALSPNIISYQGRLTTADGSPANGTYSLTFALYKTSTGGAPDWSETQTGILVDDGLFAVKLGIYTPFSDPVLNDASHYLGISIDGGPELAPRTQMISSPYALRVRSIDQALGGAIIGYLSTTEQIYTNLEYAGVAISGECATEVGYNNTGIQGIAGSGVFNRGVYGVASDGPTGSYNSAGIYGASVGLHGGTIWAGYFDGWTSVVGNFYASAKFFKIDDPQHPADRTLTHSCVESDEYKDIYDGIATTDASGKATVTLPDWFDGLNREFRYQLTCIGQFAQAIVSREISNDQFEIATDKPNIKVSWQVTGIRKDAYATAHPFPVIEDKPAELRGKYLNPVENGVSEELGVNFAARKQALDLANKNAIH